MKQIFTKIVALIIIIIVVVQVHNVQESHCWTFEETISNSESENCAELIYSSGDVGETLTIQHGNRIVDLNNLYLKSSSLNSWASSVTPSASSVHISSGCSLSICSQPYFQGNCQEIITNQTVLEQKIVSTSCKCKKDCESVKCPGVIIKGSTECGRAFIENGCNTCSGMYLDIMTGNNSFIGTYAENITIGIKSFVIKSGCKLYSYDERDFEGILQIFQSGSHNNLHGRSIESYRCECNSHETQQKKSLSTVRPLNYPPIISIPDTIENFTSQFFNEPLKSHKGVLSAIKSIENKRSSKNAYIMFLGMTGAGKSASINFLFGNRSIAEIGEVESITSEINEYVFPVPLNELGISNSELHVIDTPGLGDTRGLKHDAQFLATLEHFMTNHVELSSRIPNVVLIFAKFTENRFSGDGANFVKMLRGLDLLSNKLFSKSFSNIVVVLTHYMSESMAVKKNPTGRIYEFKKVIEEFSLFPKPIVVTVAENRPEDEELPIVNGYYQLPTGELYPHNVFDKIKQVTQNSGDPIGEAIFKSAFQDPEQLKMSKNVSPLLNESNLNVLHYLNILTAANFKIEDTEISTILANVYNNNTYFTNELRSKYPDTLPYIQLVLNVRNIFKLKNTPKTTIEIIQLLKDIRKTPGTILLLEKALNIKAPFFEGPYLVGSSYDVFGDNIIIGSSPFNLNRDNSKISELGYLIPTDITCKIQKDYQNINYLFDSKQEYYKSRLTNLGIKNDNVNVDRFTGKVKPGYTLVNSALAQENLISVYQERRYFKFELNEKFVLTTQFIEIVKELPIFTTHNQVILDRYKTFFKIYGTHIVQAAYGGGTLETNLKKEPTYTKEGIKDKLLKMTEIVNSLADGKMYLNLQAENFSILLRSGHSDTKIENLRFIDRLKIIEAWKESFTIEPVMFESSVKLIPISEIAKRVNTESGIQVSKALTELLTSRVGLVYTPDPEILRLERERNEEKVRIEARRVEEERLAAERIAEAKRLEIERKKEEELKQKLEEKRIELERIQKQIEAERLLQQEAFLALQKQIQAENAKKREEEERELRRVAEEQRIERERLAELQRLETARREEERRRAEAAIAEAQRLERERVERELAAQRQRQLEAEQALQRQLEAERAASAKAAADAAAAEAAAAAAIPSGCPQSGRYRGRRSINNSSSNELNQIPINSKYSHINTKFLNAELKVVTFEEVILHDKPFDFWVILFDRVYDVTSFREKHPGGEAVMLEYAGQDATFAFQTAGHGKMDKLEPYLIGVLPSEERLFSYNYVLTK